METGLEKMRDVLTKNGKWKQIQFEENEFGDAKDLWYNESVDVSCCMYYDKDMDQELYLTEMHFYNGEELKV